MSTHRSALPGGLVTRCLLALLLVAGSLNANVFAAIPADGIYEVQTVAAGTAPRFAITRGELRHASGALHSPLCQQAAAGHTQFPVVDLATFFHGYPGTQVIDRGDGHYLLTTGLVLDEHLQFISTGSGAVAVVYAELDFSTPDEGTLTLQAATPYFIGDGLDTTHCLARAQHPVKKVGS